MFDSSNKNDLTIFDYHCHHYLLPYLNDIYFFFLEIAHTCSIHQITTLFLPLPLA